MFVVSNARVINNDECKCKIYSSSDMDNGNQIQCNDQHVLILPDFSSTDYSKDASQIIIHPPKFSGIRLHLSICMHAYIWGCN